MTPNTGQRELARIVLTEPKPQRKLQRPHSLRQEYEEFILQRIEEYKEQLSRKELLSLGDDAVHELDAGPEGQLVLTEVMMLDHVDRLIKRRLRLPSYRRWRNKHLNLRQAQQDPMHWGLPTDTPLPDLACRLEQHESALIVGARLAPAAMMLAAYHANVLLVDRDIQAIERAESRAVTEALSTRFQALVIDLTGWLPDLDPTLTVVDPQLVASLDKPTRHDLLAALKSRTGAGGVHLIMPQTQVEEISAPEAEWRHSYIGWSIEVRMRGDRFGWLMAERR